MASTYGITKRIYHAIVPHSIRDGLYRITPAPLKDLKRWGLQKLAKGARHDEIYDADYYASIIEPTMKSSAAIMAKTIVDELAPARVVDVGCGSGVLLDALRGHGVAGVGLEYAQAGVDLCKQRGLDVRQFDIEHHAFPEIPADLVISTEVAEHLPAACADRFVDLLCHFARRIVLTAAEPGGEGTDHINEQPPEYWIAKFVARGYRFEKDQALRWRATWKQQGVAHCFHSTLMIFQKPAT